MRHNRFCLTPRTSHLKTRMNANQLLTREKSSYPKVEAPCPYFGTCGGCAIQDLAYADQLRLKQERIRRAFEPMGAVPLSAIVGLEDPWRYRNKAELTFSEANGRLTLGYHAARSFWRIVDLDDCLLLPEPAMRAARDARSLAERTGLPAYQPRSHQGCFRYLLVRHSQATGKILICLITSRQAGGGESGEGPLRRIIEPLATALMARHPAISSFYWGLTDRLADIAMPEELLLLAGVPHLEDRLGPFRLKLHPLSFLQPSSVQADRLYTRLCEGLPDLSIGVAWDLYCGVGLVGFYLSRRCRKIYGIDAEPRHLELAALNAALNGLDNIEFRAGQVEALLMDRRFWLQEAKPDLIVVDPPRAGLHPQALASLPAARPRAIAYISCNAQSLARDLGRLLSGFPRYRLDVVQPFDMFPQTNHVEILVLLTRS